MTISAKIVLDSISPAGVRITTWELDYWRMIHSELMTHKMISKCSASSRAIPSKKMIERIRADPARSISWGKNQKGMQANEDVSPEIAAKAEEIWLRAMEAAIGFSEELAELGIHKQITNRLVEPWMHIKVVATATDWDNFYALRAHSAAEPNFQALAYKMLEIHNKSIPTLLQIGQWHLPYFGYATEGEDGFKEAQMTSVARCARTSYANTDGKISTIDEDRVMFDRLVGSRPVHASPAEHQGTPFENPNERSGNFRGWFQLRKALPLEFVARDPRLL